MVLFICVCLTSCAHNKKVKPEIEAFDIRNGKILYVLNVGFYQIRCYDLNSSTDASIIDAPKNTIFSNPVFLDDGSFLFLKYSSLEPLKTTICKCNLSSKVFKEYQTVNGAISSFVVRNNGIELIVSLSSENQQHSPLVEKKPHGYNIYSMDTKSGKLELVSELEAYEISYLSLKDNNTLLFQIQGGYNGLMVCNLKTHKVTTVNPLNNPRVDPTFYRTPLFSNEDSFYLFTAPYEMYIMGADHGEAKTIYRSNSSNIQDVKLNPERKKIVFTKQWEPYFYMMDYNGENVKILKLGR